MRNRNRQILLPNPRSNNNGNYNGWKGRPRRNRRGNSLIWCIENFKFVAITSTIILVVGAASVLVIKNKVNIAVRDAKIKKLEEQRNDNILMDNGDGTKTTDFTQALQFKLDELETNLKKDFSESGITTLYIDRLYETKEDREEKRKKGAGKDTNAEGEKEIKSNSNTPSYEENPDLYINVMHTYKTHLNGTINLSTNILPAFKYSYDPRKFEITQLGKSVYVNIPDSAFIAEGFEEARGGSTAKDSFGATVSQMFNKKDEEESKAHDSFESSIKKTIDKAAKERLLDANIITEVREVAVKTLYDSLKPYMNTSHLIIKANGAQLSEELKIIEENKK